jgi:succinate-semialdehyde dehydrogenase / glutarate-semialdehyde dehydrogenase
MKNEDVLLILSDVQQSWLSWKEVPLQERCRLIGKVGDELLRQKSYLAEICTREMGKPLRESIAEVEKCALACRYYAENGEAFLQDEQINTEAQESFLTYRPLGIILAVMPWNFPYWQVIRFAAPALCAGNAAVLKHASLVPGCALALEKVFTDAGVPQNVFRALLISASEVNAVIEHPFVKAVTLTGSTEAGKKVAMKAGECLKKTVLELGGSDAYLILADADLNHAAKTLVTGRMRNAGQSCISPKRLIVLKEIYKGFTEKVLGELRNYKFGDPFSETSDLGPIARLDLRDELHQQVLKTVSQGAKLLLGGVVPAENGAFYPPTLLADVKPGMCAFDEELFGPVVCLVEAENLSDAIKLANQSQYGLGAGIFTQNRTLARELAVNDLETGGVFVNDFLQSDPRLPFGGIKDSGYGRELSSLGIREFVNAKTILIK